MRILILFVVLIFLVGAYFVTRAPVQAPIATIPPSGPPKPRAWTDEDRRQAYEMRKRDNLDLIYVRSLRWRAGGFGTVAIATLSVESKLDVDIKDLVFSCKFFGKSGTLINEADKTIYDFMKGKSTRQFRDVNFGYVNAQAERASCRVVGYDYVVEPPPRG